MKEVSIIKCFMNKNMKDIISPKWSNLYCRFSWHTPMALAGQLSVQVFC